VWGQVQGKNNQWQKKRKKKIQWSATKRNGLWWTPYSAEWKNAAHLMDKITNWCIGGYLFTLAEATSQAMFVNIWCYIRWFISCVFAYWPKSFESQWKMLKFTSCLWFTNNYCKLCWSISNITPLKQIQSHRISKPMCQWDTNGPSFSCVHQGSSRNVHWQLQFKFTQSIRLSSLPTPLNMYIFTFKPFPCIISLCSLCHILILNMHDKFLKFKYLKLG